MQTDSSKTKRMRELISVLSDAAKAYYQESREIMSNFEYDRLYDELLKLEKETGTVLSGSPSQNVGYEVLSALPKEQHEKPMLSLDKTKNVDDLKAWLKDKQALLSWKLDGLTIVLTYEDGALAKAVTRGNGYIGEVITNNAKVFRNVPLKISYTGQLILRGEAVIRYSDFVRINETISEADAKYKNPRNLCAGSVRQLDPKITRSRNVYFNAFSLVSAPDVDFHNSRKEQFDWLSSLGFDVVEHVMVTADTLADEVKLFAEKIKDYDIPSDGLVLLLEDIAYGNSLGSTAKFPRNSIAFKWSDETAVTKLRYIEWSPSRTGLINPVAVFDPVELEGTTVSRASVHNVSILESMKLGEGDEITVYKANMIIPQIAENLTKSGTVKIPDRCPVCGGPAKIHTDTDRILEKDGIPETDEDGGGRVKTLWCENPDCVIKKIKSFALMASRDALNIDGLSEMTLEKFIAAGFIHSYADIFRLDRFRDQIITMEGFGEKSFSNLIEAAKKAEHTNMSRFVYSLGIPGIGLANAKMLSRHFRGDFTAFRHAPKEELFTTEGIGEVLGQAVIDYFAEPGNQAAVDDLLSVVTIEPEETNETPAVLSGKTFVITGEVHRFENREALKEFIEARGGKATSSVTSKTTYLINNDTASNSAKNKKARELGIPVLSEEEFLKIAEGEA